MAEPARRVPLNVRIARPSLGFIDALAAERAENKSVTVRTMLTFAARHMPRGWKP